jgi:iron(III) transport system substrate-binding protein
MSLLSKYARELLRCSISFGIFSRHGFSLLWLLLVMSLLGAGAGCVPRAENSVVIYSAADREYAQPILAAFARRHSSTEVVPQFDVESTKTVGLVTRIESERERPRADVFWNNEILHTLRLEQAGLLQPVAWDIPSDWPKNMRSAHGNWVGFAARARVLLVNRELLPDGESRPDSVLDLGDPQWKSRCGVALPLFGTTATHFTVLRDRLGQTEADLWFQAVKDNAVVLGGNKQVAQAVASGQLAFGLTDTDDALIEIDAGLPVEIVFPDQRPDQSGTLRIPNTVVVLAGCPHPVAAAELANYLVSSDTEGRLAMGVSGQFPVRPGHEQSSRAQAGNPVRWMDADFTTAAQQWDAAAEKLRSIFR